MEIDRKDTFEQNKFQKLKKNFGIITKNKHLDGDILKIEKVDVITCKDMEAVIKE